MNLTGIITEYNPLHNGHKYHIQATKKLTECDGIICIMSGNFVQRGTPSIIDKWSRAKAALKLGADIIIELPLVFSLSSAEFFAFGAVNLLNSLGVINNICFGSECGDINLIYNLANVLCKEPYELKYYLKLYLSQGLSYPAARNKALMHIFSNESNIIETIRHPNNILAIEYCKSLIKLNSTIKPFAITRIGSSYNDSNLCGNFSSASAIRKYLKDKKPIENLKGMLPHCSFETLYENYSNCTLTFEDSIFNYIKYKALTSENKLENLPDVSEGLHNKIYNLLRNSNSYEELINSIKSKRYTYTRISRILCQYFIGFENYDIKELRKTPPQYARVLGFNNRGREILRVLKKTSSIPIYTKIPKSPNNMLGLDIQGTRAYSLINNSISQNEDFIASPIRLF